MFKRPGVLSDRLVSPYPNEEYARFVNGNDDECADPFSNDRFC